MRKAAKEVVLENSSELIDIVGTGGDGSHSFNISTGAALLIAGEWVSWGQFVRS